MDWLSLYLSGSCHRRTPGRFFRAYATGLSDGNITYLKGQVTTLGNPHVHCGLSFHTYILPNIG
jgi:hypothetical protein